MITTKVFGMLALAVTVSLVTACDDDIDDLDDVIDERLDDLDLDDDFVVTRSEWHEGFLIWDDDNDQILVVGEFRFNGGAFDAADLNNDGFVTSTEWEQILDRWDIDNDDLLEEIEFEPYL